MKKIIFSLLTAVVLMGLSACTSEEDQVKKAAKQFVTALNNDDGQAILATYPGAEGASLQNYFLPDSVKVAWDENDSIYTLTFDEGVYALARWYKEEKRLEIFDSKNLMTYNSYRIEYLQRGGYDTSAPMDLELKSVVDDSEYVDFIFQKFEAALTANLTVAFKVERTESFSSVFVDYTITNNGDVDVQDGVYKMEVEYLDAQGKVLSTEVAKDFKYSNGIRAHQSYGSLTEPYGGFVSAIAGAQARFYFKLQPDDMILTYATFSGNEYEEYKASKKAE